MGHIAVCSELYETADELVWGEQRAVWQVGGHVKCAWSWGVHARRAYCLLQPPLSFIDGHLMPVRELTSLTLVW